MSDAVRVPGDGQRIRLLRVIGRLNIGGPAVHATLLTERLDPTRYDSLLVAGTEDQAEGNYLTLHGRSLPRLTILPELRRDIRGWADLRVLVQLVRLMREQQPHIVDTHTAKAGVLGRLAARLAGVPIVVHTYHGHIFHGYFSPAKTRGFLAIDRWLARRTDRLLAVSETVRSELLSLGIGTERQIEVMPFGLDLEALLRSEEFRGQLRAELGLGEAAPLVGVVARLVPIKGHEVFLGAAAVVARRLPESLFLVIGDGVRRSELQALARGLGLGDRVRFLGWRGDLTRIYADLDLVVLSSRSEGLPVSLVEAMAAGRAVLATRVGGVPDLVEEGVNGCLVPPDDVPALADRMIDLLEDPERRRALGEAGRKAVFPAFAADRLLTKVDRLYTSLIREKVAGDPA